MFQAVAPFFPLGQQELQEIARRKLQGEWFRQVATASSSSVGKKQPRNHSYISGGPHYYHHGLRLVVLDAFVVALVDPSRVEYL